MSAGCEYFVLSRPIDFWWGNTPRRLWGGQEQTEKKPKNLHNFLYPRIKILHTGDHSTSRRVQLVAPISKNQKGTIIFTELALRSISCDVPVLFVVCYLLSRPCNFFCHGPSRRLKAMALASPCKEGSPLA